MAFGRQLETILTVSDLIDSGQLQRAEKLLEGKPLEGALGVIHRAEVHTYFDRLVDARESLGRIQPVDLSLDEAARFAQARGEWHYWRFELKPAERYFHTAKYNYRLIGDEFGLAKSLYNLGRIRRRQADFPSARKYLNQALSLIKEHKGDKKDYLKALIDFNLGVCAHQLGQLDEAAEFYDSAIVCLKKLEHGKYYGATLNSFGMLLIRNGRYEEALSVLNECIGVLQGVAAFEPIAHSTNNLALALIRLGRFEEAERLLKETNELGLRTGNITGGSIFLETSAQLNLERGELRKAEDIALKAIEQAELSQNEFVKAEALITLGCIRIKRNEFSQAAQSLQQAYEIGERLNSKMLQTPALLYLAECETPTVPIKAKERLVQVREMLEDYHDARMQREFERISQRPKGERVKVTPDNMFIINGNFLPNWYEVKAAVETFLIKNALRQSGGNLTKAGKTLGISKVHVYQKRKQYEL